MTWGQIRLQLLSSAPGLSLDLIDEFVVNRYQMVLDATNWIGLSGSGTVSSVAAYQPASTVTIATSIGSTTITGTGTAFTAGMVGYKIYIPGLTAVYTIATYASSTSITIDRGFEGNGTDASGTAYTGRQFVVYQDIYALPSGCKALVSVTDPITNLPMPVMSLAAFNSSCGPRNLVGNPGVVGICDDSSESSPPVLQRIQFYPPPQYARGFAVEYTREGNQFTGSNTTVSPLPFVSDAAILAGARSDIQKELKNYVGAQVYQRDFEQEVGRLLLVEHAQRRAPSRIKMASRFTRHREWRVPRGGRSGWGAGQGGPN